MLYVVHGNTYYYGYGYIENIFGIYAKKDDAEAAKELITKKLYEKEIAKGQMSVVEDISDVEVEIAEIEAGRLVEIECPIMISPLDVLRITYRGIKYEPRSLS